MRLVILIRLHQSLHIPDLVHQAADRQLTGDINVDGMGGKASKILQFNLERTEAHADDPEALKDPLFHHFQLRKLHQRHVRLATDRDTLKTIMRRSVPATAQDVVLVFITVTGVRDGQLVQEVFTRKIFAKTVCGVPMSAIQITTAGAMCAVLDLFREKKLPQSGFVRQEQVSLRDFLANRFGQLYEGRALDAMATV